MATKITERVSKIEYTDQQLVGTDRLVISQTNGTKKKTVNIGMGELYQLLDQRISENGLGEIVNLGHGLSGKGAAHDPIKLDDNWLNQSLIRRGTVSITSVGDRNTRYLPISRKMISDITRISTNGNHCLPSACVEQSGELKLIHPNTNYAHTVSVGDWCDRQTLDNVQVLERPITPPTLPLSCSVRGVVGASYTSAVLHVWNKETNKEEFWFVDLTDGSLNEDSFIDPVRIGTYTGNPDTDPFYRNSIAAFKTSTGRYIMYVDRNKSDPNAACTIQCRRVVGSGTTGSLTVVNTWNINSYAGLFSAQPSLKISDKFLGTASEKCELTNLTPAKITLGYLNTSKQPTQLQIIQPMNAQENVHLVVRREFKLNAGNDQDGLPIEMKYVADMTFKITISTSGIGNATAISRYSGTRPTVALTASGGWEFKNYRDTFVTDPALVSELLYILTDGSIMTIRDDATVAIGQQITVYKSPEGYTNADLIDLHAAVNARVHGKGLKLNPLPLYTKPTTVPEKAVYIASPIRVYMNTSDFKIPAQVLDLTSVLSSQSAVRIGDFPYARGEFSGIQAKVAYLYAQPNGREGRLLVTARAQSEALNNTLIAMAIFPTDGSPSILFGQAYSRMGRNRLSYMPMGASVPVSYGNPAQAPNRYWLQQAAGNSVTPTFWKDAACTIPAYYAIVGSVLYVRLDLTGFPTGNTYNVRVGEQSLANQNYNGSALVYSVTVGASGSTLSTPVPTAVVVTNVSQNREIGRGTVMKVDSDIVIDVVTENAGNIVTYTTPQSFDVFLRINCYGLNIGDQVRVTVGGAENITIDTFTYDGFVKYITFVPAKVGTYNFTATKVGTSVVSETFSLSSTTPVLEFGPGTHQVVIPPYRSVEINLVGGGGGGGGAVNNRSPVWDVQALGGDGEDTSLNVAGSYVLAGGGTGGTDGHWLNLSGYIDGLPGYGGDIEIPQQGQLEVSTSLEGNDAELVSPDQRQPGGATLMSTAPTATNGQGGQGAWGLGKYLYGFGAGGGSGARIDVVYRNYSDKPVTANIVVGAGGIGWVPTSQTWGNPGENGSSGFARVTYR